MIVSCKTRSGANDSVSVFSVNDVVLNKHYTTCRKSGNQKNKREYVKQFGTFDIETTSVTHKEIDPLTGEETIVPDYAYMYVWSACIDGVEVAGRTWNEFIVLLEKIHKHYATNEMRKFVIYVHNLSFEFAFMSGYFADNSDLFCTRPRKVLKYVLNTLGVEFRCSMKLTNMSLDKFTQKMAGCTHVKAVEHNENGKKADLDYTLVRHCETVITDEEWGYIINDTLGLWEALKYKMQKDGHNVATIPMTSTGYIRRLIKEAVDKYCPYIREKLALTDETYHIVKEAFRGGDTHANMFKAGRVYHDVYSHDASSMYPFCMLAFDYPETALSLVDDDDLEEEYLMRDGHMFVGEVTFRNIELKPDCYNPYISISKKIGVAKGVDIDNGRVLSADEITICIDSNDYHIIKDSYDFEAEFCVGRVYESRLAPMPQPIREVLLNLVKDKSELKIAVKRSKPFSEEKESNEYDLGKSKNLLNGTYGLSATDPVHDQIFYDGEMWYTFDRLEYNSIPDYKALIDDIGAKIKDEKSIYESTKESALPYIYGFWTTSLARRHLHRIQKLAGADIIYWDTDSCKSTKMDFEGLAKLNQWVYDLCDRTGTYVEVEGKRIYIGYFDNESNRKDIINPPTYEVFKTLGAKRYAYNVYGENKDDAKFGATVSGISKERGKVAIGSIDNFKEGLKVPNCGGFQLTYIDSKTITRREIKDYRGVEGVAEYCGAIVMIPRTYTLELTDDQWMHYKLDEQIEE